MRFGKTFILDMYAPAKDILLSRGAACCLLVSFAVGGAVYIKQNHMQRHTVQQKIADLKNVDANYMLVINELQVHIESLNSRVKHLSNDNKRLSATGNKLSKQLDISQSRIAKKFSQTKVLQLELATLDHNIIRGYEDFIEKQEVVINLQVECKKNKDKNRKENKEKSKKCEAYALERNHVESIALQLKHLKAKREVVLSQMARVDGGL